MNKIHNICLQAITMRRLLSAKKIANVKKANPKNGLTKSLTRISVMLTKKQQPTQSKEAPNVKSKAIKAGAQSDQQDARTTSATITSPYSGITKTRITVKYDVGFGNSLTLRGQGANLSWHKGIPMRNVKSDEWVWETDIPFATAEFKVLINDRDYEMGRNHLLHSGTMVQYTPRF